VTDPDVTGHLCAENLSVPWSAPIELHQPFWRDYRPLISRLQAVSGNGPDLPALSQLQAVLPESVRNHSGQYVTLVAGEALSGAGYEETIFLTGEISTRINNWHDLFNALVWARFPRLKAAMNAVHYQQIGLQKHSRRNRLRDALTLLDECGVIVASANRELLLHLAALDWHAAFRQRAECWRDEIQIFVCGHALLEKFLHPYKSLTAHAALVWLGFSPRGWSREHLLRALDQRLAEILLSGGQLHSPSGLSPLPLMGIPGWWPGGPQDESFYADREVFRLPRKNFRPASLFSLATNEHYQDMP